MTTVATARKSAAATLAAVLVGLMTAVVPSGAALAATDNSRSTLVSYINKVRVSAGDAKFASNEYLDDFAQAWAVKLANANGAEGSTVSAPTKPLPPVNSTGTAAALVNVQCVDKKNSGTATDNGIRYCLRYDYDFFAAPDSFNYMGIGVVTTSKKTFAVMVLAEYPSGAARKLTSATPTITGSGRVGERLGVKVGAWSPSTGVTFTYRWRLDGATVSTDSSFVPRPEHRGRSITVSVTGTRSGYWSPSNPHTSAATTITSGRITQGAITVQGERYPGRTLTVVTSGWTPSNLSMTYQWLRNGVAISGATGVSYAQINSDAGAVVNVRITASSPGYSTLTVTTIGTTPTRGRSFEAAPVPTISGSAKFGAKLTASAGQWQPAPVELSYRWNIDGAPVSGATSTTFSVPAQAVGKRITVTVTGSKFGFETTARNSLPTATIASLPFTSTPAPVISGSTLAGRTLTAQTAAWSPAATITYRWFRNGTEIAGERSATYVTGSSDRGASISVRAAGRRSGYTTTTVFSDPVVIR